MARPVITQPRLQTREMNYSILYPNGSGDYIDIALEQFDPNSGNCSLTMWAKLDVVPKDGTPANDANLYSQQNGGAGTGRTWLYIDRLNNKLSTFINGSTNNTSFIVQQGQWNYYALTYRTSGTTVNVYANGVVVGVFTITPTSATGSHRIGQNKTDTAKFYGNIAQTRFYTRELSASDIQNDYYYAIVDRTSLDYEFLYSNGSGTTITDSSGNNKNGTLNGGAWSTEVPLKIRGNASARSNASTRSPA